MTVPDYIESWRSWFPIPTSDGGIDLTRWLLLEGNRYAVTGALLTMTLVSIIGIGSLWTFKMSLILTETQAVQTVLNSFLSGIILLVSIVVSINSIVLSYDITHIDTQEDRVEGMMQFRDRVGRTTGTEVSPTDPNSFLNAMAETIRQEANELAADTEDSDEDVQKYIDRIIETTDHLERSISDGGNGRFGVLWRGLETDYGPMVNQSREITSKYEDDIPESRKEHFDNLIEALELFATGREYFKTLYYTLEISELSRTLLVVSLPAIVVTASTILAINAGLLPDVWVFGLPPLLTFVSLSMTIALAPFLVLTAYMLRVATVARRTAGAGPFIIQS
ncbi:hypothetical protein [Halostella litorea]|uniref:hypothetical protein n=1 Tax=Halostella litorea TaxID=2528831 RepID=UPI00109321D0|nr:hypothetical protein [Halostella litorea]